MTKDQPERIHGWLNTQLSIARHYGGISYNGAHYVIAYNEEGQPLVREDVLRSEMKERNRKALAERAQAKAAKVQGVLL